MAIAIIETGGKQYKVFPKTRLRIEKIEGQEGDAVVFDKVLLVGERDAVVIGTPYVSGATVAAKIVRVGRDDKKIVFRYHSKTRYRKKKGHRQPFTEIEVLEIKN
jgi:large subunit ribosomal protein L21